MQIRHAISARLDGEDPGLDDAAVDAHLAGCTDCRGFAHDAEALHRTVRLAPAPAIPDLTPGILAAIGADDAPTPTRVRHATTRCAGSSSAIAVVQIAVAIPALLFGSDAGLPVHTARHLGSFDVALGVGFLFAAWKPSRIPGLLPGRRRAGRVPRRLVAARRRGGEHRARSARCTTSPTSSGLAVVWLLSRPDAATACSSRCMIRRLLALGALVVALVVVARRARVGARDAAHHRPAERRRVRQVAAPR